jgi:hypothetical protein
MNTIMQVVSTYADMIKLTVLKQNQGNPIDLSALGQEVHIHYIPTYLIDQLNRPS